MGRITWPDKVENGGATADGRLSSADANQIKAAVNSNYDDIRSLLIPVGLVLPFYGTEAPNGYLACDGREILKDDYPQLVDHLIKMRKPARITWNSLDMGATVLHGKVYIGNYVTLDGNLDNIYQIVAVDMRDGGENCNAKYVTVVGEDAPTSGTANVTAYNSLTDIPLTDAVYLPDLRGQYISGYDSRTSRFVGTGEGDASRKIEGTIDLAASATPDETGVFVGTTMQGNSNTISGSGSKFVRASVDSSRVVPTDSTNHPQNVNLLYCIKAYDLLSTSSYTSESNTLLQRIEALEAALLTE
jgi:hypothetical protein